jgi:hypothetical protein
VVFHDDLVFLLFFIFPKFQLVFAHEDLGCGVIDAEFARSLTDAELIGEDLLDKVFLFLGKLTSTS